MATAVALFYQPLLVLLTLVRGNEDDERSCADWQSHLIGTTLLMIATDAFKKYQTATGGVPDQSTGLLSISSSQFSTLESLFIEVGGVCVLSRVDLLQCGVVISLPFSPG